MSLKSDQDRGIDFVAKFDEFGFAVFKEESSYFEDDGRCHDYRDHFTLKKEKAWKQILSSLDGNQFLSPQHIRVAIKHGVPKDVRGELWSTLLGASAIKANNSVDYQTVLGEIRSLLVDLGVSEYGGRSCIQRLGQVIGKIKLVDKNNDDSPESIQTRTSAKAEIHHKLVVLRQIMLDLDRSFPTHRLFMNGSPEGREGRAALFRVLAVYSQYNKAVSYCQGMSYIAGMLLMNMEEEKAFWCLVSLFERPKYLVGYFDNSLSKIQRHARVFEVLMKQRKNRLYKHLEKQDINCLMYLTPWFMALFTSLPCWDTVLFIWDMIILEGVSVIFQVALSLLEVLSDSLINSNEMCHCLPLLLHPPANLVNWRNIVPIVLRTTVQKWEIVSIQQVLDEEEDNRNMLANKRRINVNKENTPSYKRFKQQSPDGAKQGTPVPVFHEPPIISRIVDYITTPIRSAIFGCTEFHGDQSKEFEMVTFKSKPYKSPPVPPGVCCSVGRSSLTVEITLNENMEKTKCNTNSPFSPTGVTKRNSRKYRKTKRLGTSPVRRSPRLANQRMQAFNASTSSLVGSSATNQHSFRVFNTPTPIRPTKVNAKNHRVPAMSSIVSPDLPFSPDVELMEISQMDKKLNFDSVNV